MIITKVTEVDNKVYEIVDLVNVDKTKAPKEYQRRMGLTGFKPRSITNL